MSEGKLKLSFVPCFQHIITLYGAFFSLFYGSDYACSFISFCSSFYISALFSA